MAKLQNSIGPRSRDGQNIKNARTVGPSFPFHTTTSLHLKGEVAKEGGGTDGGHVADHGRGGSSRQGLGGSGASARLLVATGRGGRGGGLGVAVVGRGVRRRRAHGSEGGGGGRRSGLLGGGGLGASRAAGDVVVGLLAVVDDLDALPRAGAVGVVVLGGLLGALAAHVVLDAQALVVAVEGSGGKVSDTASPVDGSLGGVLATSDPGSELDLHGRLGVTGAALDAGVLESAHNGAVDDPVELLRGPLNGVSVELVDRVGDGRETATIVGVGATLAKEVGLDLGGVAAESLPVDLIEVVRLEHEAGHDTDATSSAHGHIDLAEEDVLLGADGGRLLLVGDGENGAEVLVILQGGAIGRLEEAVGALAEVDVDDLGANGLGVGATICETFMLARAR